MIYCNIWWCIFTVPTIKLADLPYPHQLWLTTAANLFTTFATLFYTMNHARKTYTVHCEFIFIHWTFFVYFWCISLKVQFMNQITIHFTYNEYNLKSTNLSVYIHVHRLQFTKFCAQKIKYYTVNSWATVCCLTSIRFYEHLNYLFNCLSKAYECKLFV